MNDEERLREATREAHGVLKDLTREMKRAKALVPELVGSILKEEVDKQSERLREHTNKTMDEATEVILKEFRKISVMVLGKAGRDAEDIKKFLETIPEVGDL